MEVAMKSRMLFLVILVFCAAPEFEASAAEKENQLEVQLPHRFENLAVYFIRGPSMDSGAKYITLEQALAEGKAKVHETGRVNRLAIENLSEDETVCILAGDIVKGGRQDRALSMDMLLAPRSGRVPVPSFCVESGRWSGRPGESSREFQKSVYMLATKELKLAARLKGGQGDVWSGVAQLQKLLEKKLKARVRDSRSKTSLQLTLEAGAVVKAVDSYFSHFRKLPKNKKDLIGFAFAINGEFAGAEVFDCSALFIKLWPKLLRSVCVEALVRSGKPKTQDPPEPKKILGRILAALAGREKDVRVAGGTNLVIKDSGLDLSFDSRQRPSVAPHNPPPCPPPPSPTPVPVPIPTPTPGPPDSKPEPGPTPVPPPPGPSPVPGPLPTPTPGAGPAPAPAPPPSQPSEERPGPSTGRKSVVPK
jgi:hypothetical protein